MSGSRFGAGIYSPKYVGDNMLLIEPRMPALSQRFVIIGSHGHGQGAENYLPYETTFGPGAHAQRLADWGFTFLAVDHARVNSWGDPDSMDALDDAYAYAMTLPGAMPKVGFMGYSMGGGVALNWMKRNPDKVACAWLWAPATDLDYFHSTSGYSPAYGVAIPNNATWTSEVNTAYEPVLTVQGSVSIPAAPAIITVNLYSAVGAMPAGNRVVPKGLVMRWDGFGLAQGFPLAAGVGGPGDTTVTAIQNGGSCIVDMAGTYAPMIQMVQVGATDTHISWRHGVVDPYSNEFFFTTPSAFPSAAFPFCSCLSGNETVNQFRVEFGTTGLLRLKDTTGSLIASSAAALALSTTYRCEVQRNGSTVTLTAYTADSNTVAATVTSTVMSLSASVDTTRLHNWQTTPSGITASYGHLIVSNSGAPIGPMFPQGRPAVWSGAGRTGSKYAYQHRDDTHLYGASLISGGGGSLTDGMNLFGAYADQSPGSRIRDEYASWRGLGIPIFVLQGDNDTVVPPGMNFNANGFIAGVADPNVTGRLAAGLGHTNPFAGADYKEVIDFFRTNLGQPIPRFEQLAGMTFADVASTSFADLGSLLP